ncbi:hypothetical protein ACFL6Y_08870 [Elusimicrobiota bacterium]
MKLLILYGFCALITVFPLSAEYEEVICWEDEDCAQDTAPPAPQEHLINTKIDLSEQWGMRASQDQGDFGYCHAFAFVGLVEAAYFRAHDEAIDFSEKWLLYQGYLLAKAEKMRSMKEKLKLVGKLAAQQEEENASLSHFYSKMGAQLPDAYNKKIETILDLSMSAGEGAKTKFSMELIKAHSLCPESTYPYWDFSDLKPKEKKLINELYESKRFFAGFLELPVESEEFQDKREELAEMCPFEFFPKRLCFYNEIRRRYNKLFKPAHQRIKCKMETRQYENFMETWDFKLYECEPNCGPIIEKYLLKGIPIVAGVRGYPNGKSQGVHSVVIKGFDPDFDHKEESTNAYLVRNSWGPKGNHHVPEDMMIKINKVIVAINEDESFIPSEE